MAYGNNKVTRIVLASFAIYLLPALANSMPICDDLCPTYTTEETCNPANCGDTDSCTWWVNSKTQDGKCAPPQKK